MSEPKDFNPWNGEYDKDFYEVLLPNGDIVLECWPNAGKMFAMDGTGRMWEVKDKIQVRKVIHPLRGRPNV